MHTKIILLCVFVHISVGNVVLDKYLWKTWKNNTFYAFRGIKYAESPTGSLRFKAPQPAKTWNNINAIIDQSLNRDGSDCPSPGVSYDEDCLFLNVYTKNWGVSKNPMPVVVFIHPGGFYIGSGSSTNHGPEYLLEEDVVLVTFNYRLAYFGFTSTGTNEAIGNAGFKDQALALQWVHDHIRYFGGDPDSVTLAGDSAGGMSVQLHMISPLSQNLFHRAFVMSGGVLPQYKHNSSQPYLIEKLARLIGCPDSEKPFDCIKRADTATITDQLRATFEFGWDNPVYPWLPIVEAPGGNEKPFLCEDPMKLFEERKFNRIPVLLSLTKDETTMSAMYLFEHRELLAQWINDFQRLGPLCMQYDANDTITKAFQERYVRYEFEDEEHYLELFVDSAQSFSDSTIIFPLHRLAQIIREVTDVYYMIFDFKGPCSYFKCNETIDKGLCDQIKTLNIVEHTDDLQYVLTTTSYPRITDEASDEGRIVTKYTKLLYNFAKYGYPYFGPNIAAESVKFNKGETFVSFNTTFEVKTEPFKDYALWDSLFPRTKN